MIVKLAAAKKGFMSIPVKDPSRIMSMFWGVLVSLRNISLACVLFSILCVNMSSPQALQTALYSASSVRHITTSYFMRLARRMAAWMATP